MTSYHEKSFQRGRLIALEGLVDALEQKRIPERSRNGFTTGNIAKYMDKSYGRLLPRTLLSVLREVGVPHDTKYRFLTWSLYAHQDELQELLERWIEERIKPLPSDFKLLGGLPADGEDAEGDTPNP